MPNKILLWWSKTKAYPTYVSSYWIFYSWQIRFILQVSSYSSNCLLSVYHLANACAISSKHSKHPVKMEKFLVRDRFDVAEKWQSVVHYKMNWKQFSKSNDFLSSLFHSVEYSRPIVVYSFYHAVRVGQLRLCPWKCFVRFIGVEQTTNYVSKGRLCLEQNGLSLLWMETLVWRLY